MDMQTLLNNFDELNAQIEAARKEMQAKSEGLIEAVAKQFLDKCPEVTGIHWTQYTPYFNDGESCEFGVNDFCFHILTDEDDEIDSYYDSTELYTQENLDKAVKDLEEAKDYTKDPDAWRQKYVKEYREKHGRDYPSTYSHIRPYPYDVDRAQERIDEITENLKTYGPEVAARIKAEFALFTAAMKKIPDDVMQAVFGDHVFVVINRNGTTVDEFNHD
jgi:hypothetical protein